MTGYCRVPCAGHDHLFPAGDKVGLGQEVMTKCICVLIVPVLNVDMRVGHRVFTGQSLGNNSSIIRKQ
ncbi:hypothetical protein SAMN04490194_2564 [Pseudomonas migulae]|uniref:Uncharacterized protein n=1 Tax=Pseudomonas migulae TaxID=78543 RepID=A0A1H5JG66_9PSED|nr:hypothetical protein SAMN04490194_2564 [Pseudomonas migulae]